MTHTPQMRRLLYNSSHCSITSRAYALEPVLLKVYSSRGEPVPRCMDALAQSKPKRIPRPCKQCLARSCMGERKLSTVSKSHAASHKPVTSFQGVVPSTAPPLEQWPQEALRRRAKCSVVRTARRPRCRARISRHATTCRVSPAASPRRAARAAQPSVACPLVSARSIQSEIPQDPPPPK